MVINKINSLIDLHGIIDVHERSYNLSNDKTQYMKWLIEQELLEEGHSLKGIANCSKRRG